MRSNITAYSSDSGNASSIIGDKSSPWAMRMTDSIVIAAKPCSMLDQNVVAVSPASVYRVLSKAG